MKFLKLENLVVAIYLAILGLSVFVLDQFGVSAKRQGDLFIGLLGMAPFALFFRVWQRLGPTSSRRFLVVHAVVLALLFVPGLELLLIAPFPLLLAAIYFAQREREARFREWLAAHHFLFVPAPPATILEKLHPANRWRCYASSLTLQSGRKIPVLLWAGEMLNSYYVGTTRTKNRDPLIAFSFSQRDVGDSFIGALDAMEQAKLSTWQRFRPSNQRRCPYLSERLPDGSYVVAWAHPHLASAMEMRMQMLRDLLESPADKPADSALATSPDGRRP